MSSPPVPRSPRRAWLALTSDCNLRCRHCFRHASPLAQVAPLSLSPRLFARLEEQLFPSLEICRIGGNNAGEPLLAPGFDELARRMNRFSFRKVLLTNGTCLTERRIEALVGAGWTIDFSLEAVNPELYARIRGRSVTPLLERIRGACRAKRRSSTAEAELRLSVAVFRENLAALLDVVDTAAKLGVDAVLVHHFLPVDEQQRDQSLVFHKSSANEVFAAARERARRRGLTLRIPPDFAITPLRGCDAAAGADPAGRWNERPCEHPWTSISVREDGAVTACCISSAVVGDLRRASVAQIWGGRRYARLRATVNRAPAGSCVNCPMRGSSFTSGECNDDDALLEGLARRGPLQRHVNRVLGRALASHPRLAELLRAYRRGRR